MANTKSAKKAFKQSEKRRIINKSRKSLVKTSINNCLQLLKENNNDKEKVLILLELRKNVAKNKNHIFMILKT